MAKRETFKNKVCATLLTIAGLIPVFVDGDATFLVFTGCIAIPLFFAKKNWIY